MDADDRGTDGTESSHGPGNAGGRGGRGASDRHGEPSGPGGSNEPGEPGGEPGDPAELLGEMRQVRRRARLARHAYWFPLVLFGLLTLGSIPFYLRPFLTRAGVSGRPSSRLGFLQSSYFPNPLFGHGLPYYWLGALLAGIAATAAWYRWRGGRVGLRTPTRGYLITALVLLILAVLIPLITGSRSQVALMPGDLLVRGTFPFLIIAVGLCVLARAERSIALTAIVVGYLGLSLLVSLYDVVNVIDRLGWHIGQPEAALANVILPGLALVISGAAAWVLQRRSAAAPQAT